MCAVLMRKVRKVRRKVERRGGRKKDRGKTQMIRDKKRERMIKKGV